MSFTQKLSLLPELSREHNMISITVSGQNTITPELFQVIDIYDGTFRVQHQKVKTHEKLLDQTILLEELSGIVNKIATGLKMSLFWAHIILLCITSKNLQETYLVSSKRI